MNLAPDIASTSPLFPFCGVIGQEQLKKALLLNCICPSIGGVLIAGEKGTAKSTIVRSLADLLPETQVITLPLNATEDMVLGSLDFEMAIKLGKAQFSPGVLAKAHNHILYIDEVNLLSESLINVILDAAASGSCTIEREGISHTFPSHFILIGSMNPEEGSLRPQILDRFGLYVECKGDDNLRNRLEIIKNRLQFEQNPVAFAESIQDEQVALKTKIQQAKVLFESIKVKDNIIQIIAEKCHKSFVAGHRGDLALINGAIAHAAWVQHKQVTLQDIEAVSDLALAHRIRSAQSPPPEPDDPKNEDDSREEKNETNEQNDHQETPPPPETMHSDVDGEQRDESSTDSLEEEHFDIGSLTLNTDVIESINDKKYRSLGSGRRSKTRTHHKHGHYVKVKIPGKTITDLAIDATLRAAAPFQRLRENNGTAIRIDRDDIRVKIREKRIGHTILFLLDTSGSMGINRRMSEAKAAVFELLKESYKKRDTVGLMKFNQEDTELVLSPTRSLELAHRCLKDIKTGGRTPLETAIEKSMELMKGLMRKNNEIQPVIILMSDGKANHTQGKTRAFQAAIKAAEKAAREKVRFIVIDTETGFVRLGLAMKLANALQGEYYLLDDLKNIKEIINAR